MKNFSTERKIIAALILVIVGAIGAAAGGGITVLGGIAQSGLPTPVAAGAPVRATFDVYGRQQMSLASALDSANDSLAIGAKRNQPGFIPSRQTALGLTSVSLSSAGLDSRLYQMSCYNPNSTVAFVHFFDTTSSVTVGSTAPLASFPVAPTGVENIPFVVPLPFTAQMKVGATMGNTYAATAPTTGLNCTFGYYQ